MFDLQHAHYYAKQLSLHIIRDRPSLQFPFSRHFFYSCLDSCVFIYIRERKIQTIARKKID